MRIESGLSVLQSFGIVVQIEWFPSFGPIVLHLPLGALGGLGGLDAFFRSSLPRNVYKGEAGRPGQETTFGQSNDAGRGGHLNQRLCSQALGVIGMKVWSERRRSNPGSLRTVPMRVPIGDVAEAVKRSS
jgi:hypothetical protein